MNIILSLVISYYNLVMYNLQTILLGRLHMWGSS